MRCDSDGVVALVVAAGYSRRFGKQDKRAARLANGKTLLAASLSSVADCFSQWRLVLRDDDQPSALGLPENTPVVASARAAQGQGASMGDGFATLLADEQLSECHSAAVVLGDMPLLSVKTLQALCAQAGRRAIVRPIYLGQQGHPVLFGRDFWAELARLDGDNGARAVIERYREYYREIAVSDAGVCTDVDTPEDLKLLGWDH